MKRSTLLIAMITALVFPVLTSAETTDKTKLDLVVIGDSAKIDDLAIKESTEKTVYRHTHTRCAIHEYYHECEVWSCASSGSTNLTQNLSCVLVDKYACDVGVDCEGDQRSSTYQGSNTFGSKGGDDTGGVPYCWSVSECNQMISDCISVGGEFVEGTTDPKTGAPNAGYCRL
ncbi:hypothetical protein [Methylomonas methanica]|uniref:Secreted protein n=1 Tax=Methylomonas methanica (strain DSM 25384 / MC09) TaxID=857087 RepID=G0A6C3_METMM|nr:hypothetical protein [Methylomonas methanica]AEG01751.1 hypothetical protein Metme_3380 [Methylomonas methanica MC09]